MAPPTTLTSPTKSPPNSLSLYILTFNCARTPISIDAFASQLHTGLPTSSPPDILVLSLQELAPVSTSFLGGTSLIPYFKRFSQAIHKAMGKNVYHTVAVKNLGMTGIMVFVRRREGVRDLEFAGVGVGVSEMGDKGAVGVRFRYVVGQNGDGDDEGEGDKETELTFVAAHLRAMEDAVLGRNVDWQRIVERLVFSSEASSGTASTAATTLSTDDDEQRPLLSISPHNAGLYKPTSYVFIAGDLNYRTSTLKPSPSDPIDSFPQPQDAPDSPKRYTELFKCDQLNQQKQAGKTLHGFHEAPVTFPPTYKYDNSKGKDGEAPEFLTPDEDVSKWNWASHRWPSWCDRILYLDTPKWVKTERKIVTHKYVALPVMESSDHRAVGLSLSVPLIKIHEPSERSEPERSELELDQEQEEDRYQDPRISPPYTIDINWKQRYDTARKWERFWGYFLYLTTTLEGGMLLAVSIAGGIGAVFAVRSFWLNTGGGDVGRGRGDL